MPESTTMRPCYVFGPWTDRAPEDPIRAVREAPNPSERAEVWLYTKEDDGMPVSSDVAGWYGCFGAMTDSVRLGPPHPIMTAVDAKASLDQMIREAGHLFAEDVERMWQMNVLLLARLGEVTQPATPTNPVPSSDVLAREMYEALPLGYDGASSLGPAQTWPWDKAPDVVRQVWRDTAMLVLRKYGQPRATPTPTRRATDADSPIGDDRAPDRYMASGRETIDEVRDVCDEVRDVCRHLSTVWLGSLASNGDGRKLGDSLFALHCVLTAYVYLSRAGRKGDAKQDHAKARWYIQMAKHVTHDHMDENGRAASLDAGRNYDDPRASRCDYKPYSDPYMQTLSAGPSSQVWPEIAVMFSPYEFGLIMVPITSPLPSR